MIPKYLGRTYHDFDRDCVYYHVIPFNIIIQLCRRAWYFFKTGISPDYVEEKIREAYVRGKDELGSQLLEARAVTQELDYRIQKMKVNHQRELLVMKHQGYQEGLHQALRVMKEQVDRQANPQVIIVKEKVKATVVREEETLSEKDYEIVE